VDQVRTPLEGKINHCFICFVMCCTAPSTLRLCRRGLPRLNAPQRKGWRLQWVFPTWYALRKTQPAQPQPRPTNLFQWRDATIDICDMSPCPSSTEIPVIQPSADMKHATKRLLAAIRRFHVTAHRAIERALAFVGFDLVSYSSAYPRTRAGSNGMKQVHLNPAWRGTPTPLDPEAGMPASHRDRNLYIIAMGRMKLQATLFRESCPLPYRLPVYPPW